MTSKCLTTTTTLTVAVASLGALGVLLSIGAVRVSADSERNGVLHVTKSCSQYTGAAGSYCTITSSNIPEIKIGAKVYYSQAFGILPGLLDSPVVLDVGTGDWAVGRCTLDASTARGLCTFSDGTGQLTGFRARINVTPFPNFIDYHWDGTYGFTDLDK
jgi:hypothetical protein